MKKTFIIILSIVSMNSFAQLNVTTLTPEINGSGGISLDQNGSLYISNFGDSLSGPNAIQTSVLFLENDSDLSTFFSEGFLGASGNTLDSNGVFYQSDVFGNAVYKIFEGEKILVSNVGLSSPVGLTFDSSNNLYICSCGNNTIRKVTPEGTSTVFSTGGFYNCPNGITVDENDNLYVSNFSNPNIIKIEPTGAASIIGNTTAGNGHIDYDINTKNLYIASFSGHQIFYLNAENPDQTRVLIGQAGIRGNTDGTVDVATFSRPNGVAISDNGDAIYINSAVPTTGLALNPQFIRKITGVLSVVLNTNSETLYQNLQTYPNPVEKEFLIRVNFRNDYTNLSIKITDVNGKLVKEIKEIDTKNLILNKIIDISDLSTGNYFYVLLNKNKKLLNGKIVKK